MEECKEWLELIKGMTELKRARGQRRDVYKDVLSCEAHQERLDTQVPSRGGPGEG